ncbi:MAG: histidine kinase, partial [Thermodesulfobacteriota bacterium]
MVRFSLRVKLSLLSLLLLLIPVIGIRASAALQQNLLASRQEALMFTAKSVATALAGRPGIFDRELFHSLNQGRDLYLFQLPKPIRLNGADDDWPMALSEAETFGADAVLFSYGP